MFLLIENFEWNFIVVGKNEVFGVKFDNDCFGVIEVFMIILCMYDINWSVNWLVVMNISILCIYVG